MYVIYDTQVKFLPRITLWTKEAYYHIVQIAERRRESPTYTPSECEWIIPGTITD